ncbi:hypothetical protein ACOI1C_13555 [Bacillus sp. DJP31]|uniref:hypothetical protein n=1 Tax=Bacillus sp. DJP31 TaxID=3409789 RepID=UPI003BB4C790
MYEVKIVDQSKKIIGLKWVGPLEPEHVEQANKELEKLITSLRSSTFDLVVDMRESGVLKTETQKKLEEHQRWLLTKGMNRAAVVFKSAVVKLQLSRTARNSDHKNEFHFDNYDDALNFLLKA